MGRPAPLGSLTLSAARPPASVSAVNGPPQRPLAAVIFDSDGVLVDSEPLANAILAQLLTELGLPTTTEQSMADFMGRSFVHTEEVVAARTGRAAPHELRERYYARLYEAFERDGLASVPAIEQALDAISLPRCVASSGPHEKIRRALRAAGLLHRFPDATIFSAQDVVHGKPAPDLFLHAAAAMGFDPATTAVVEDSPAGAEAGRAAGMVVLGYAGRTPAPLLRAAGATTVFTQMGELPQLLAARVA
jgi:HAD superfamily hydrolase (TIGR01509 family)